MLMLACGPGVHVLFCAGLFSFVKPTASKSPEGVAPAWVPVTALWAPQDGPKRPTQNPAANQNARNVPMNTGISRQSHSGAVLCCEHGRLSAGIHAGCFGTAAAAEQASAAAAGRLRPTPPAQ
jgi:hypothetical protein